MSFTGQEMLKTGVLLLRGATGGNLWQYTGLLGDMSVVVMSKNRFKVYFKQTTRTKQTKINLINYHQSERNLHC